VTVQLCAKLGKKWLTKEKVIVTGWFMWHVTAG
jgi:hypothetical protein